MEFYSAYYKKLAKYEQQSQNGEKLNLLDAKDTSKRKTSPSNIFTSQYSVNLEENIFSNKATEGSIFSEKTIRDLNIET